MTDPLICEVILSRGSNVISRSTMVVDLVVPCQHQYETPIMFNDDKDALNKYQIFFSGMKHGGQYVNWGPLTRFVETT